MDKKVEKYAGLLNISIDELKSNIRTEEIVDKKHVIWYYLRKSGYTTVSIAKYFNMNTHSSVVCAVSRINSLLDVHDRKIEELMDLLTCQ